MIDLTEESRRDMVLSERPLEPSGSGGFSHPAPVRRETRYRVHLRFAVTITSATVLGRSFSRSAISSSVFLPVMWSASARFSWGSVQDSVGCSERGCRSSGGAAGWLPLRRGRGRAGEMEGAVGRSRRPTPDVGRDDERR
jgi:hypothetical protein